MGIIVASFKGIGKSTLVSELNDKVKVLDVEDLDTEEKVDDLIGKVDGYDIVFVPTSKFVLDSLCSRNIDFDVFYPSSERRIEFSENQVKKKSSFKEIRDLDINFDDMVKGIDSIESEFCHKHKLENRGEFISSYEPLKNYISSLK